MYLHFELHHHSNNIHVPTFADQIKNVTFLKHFLFEGGIFDLFKLCTVNK